MRSYARWTCVLTAIVTMSATVDAGVVRPVPLPERARGASRIVVATVGDITAGYQRNAFGDELIVSHARLKVEERLKGTAGDVTLALEGGTVNGITLRVSDLPTLAAGERAVFFLTAMPNGEFAPHLRGQGILKLDATNHVRGSSLSLDEIRYIAAAVNR